VDAPNQTNLPAIRVPRYITRAFIRENRFKLTFIFSDDLTKAAMLGQAAQCAGEGNCFPVPTKKRNCRTESQYFRDAEFDLLLRYYIDRALAEVPTKLPVIPFPDIGCGEAELPKRAPKTLEYIRLKIQEIAYPNIERVEKL